MLSRIAIGAALGLGLALAGCGPAATGDSATTGDHSAQADTSKSTQLTSQAKPNIPAPARTHGLWTFTDVAANGDELSTDQLCVGPKSEAVYSAFRQIGNGGDCTERTFVKTASGYTYTAVCGVPGMKPVTTKGVLTGDVATGYTLEETLDLSPEGDDQKIVAKHVGPCPATLSDGQFKNGTMGMVSSVTLQ